MKKTYLSRYVLRVSLRLDAMLPLCSLLQVTGAWHGRHSPLSQSSWPSKSEMSSRVPCSLPSCGSATASMEEPVSMTASWKTTGRGDSRCIFEYRCSSSLVRPRSSSKLFSLTEDNLDQTYFPFLYYQNCFGAKWKSVASKNSSHTRVFASVIPKAAVLRQSGMTFSGMTGLKCRFTFYVSPFY